MSFVLRHITRRAGGGDIVRLRNIDAPEPILGRGSDCDIQLSDLAVAPRHAVLRHAGPGRVSIEAFGELTFEWKGAFVSKADLSLAETRHIGFGSYVLTLSAGGRPSEVVVTVAPGEAMPDTLAATGIDRVFSKEAAPFSTRQAAWAAGLGVLALCLALPVAAFFLPRDSTRTITNAMGTDKQWSSGPLVPGHHFLETNCQACHRQAFVAVRDDACLTCHGPRLDGSTATRLAAEIRAAGSSLPPRPVGDHAMSARLLQAAPFDPDPGRRIEEWFARTFHHPNDRCASCHIEHVGNKADLPPAALAQAKISPRPLLTTAVAQRNSCEDCHATLSRRLPDTRLADAPNWERHPDFHPLVTLSPGGASGPRFAPMAISSQPRENTGLTFSHKTHLLPAGGVARMAQQLGTARGYGVPLNCANCHRPNGPDAEPLAAPDNAPIDPLGFAPVEMVRDCAACHSLDYAQQGGVLRTLPHGKPDKVVDALRVAFGRVAFGRVDMGSGNAGGFVWRPNIEQAAERAVAPASLAGAVRALYTRGGACFGCHAVTGPKNSVSLVFDVAPVRLPSRYLQRGEYDHRIEQHRQNAEGTPVCDTCHEAAKSDRATDLILPGIEKCASCHGKTKPAVAAAASAQCAECHGFHDATKPGTAEPKRLAQGGRD